MNCPMHMRELAESEKLKKNTERESLKELEVFLAGPEEEYLS